MVTELTSFLEVGHFLWVTLIRSSSQDPSSDVMKFSNTKHLIRYTKTIFINAFRNHENYLLLLQAALSEKRILRRGKDFLDIAAAL